MILKSFLVEKNLSIVDEYFVTLFYGENIGLKDEIKKRIKEKYKNYEQINFNQDEVIKNEALEEQIYNVSLFSKNKVIFVSEISDKIKKKIIEITEKPQNNIRIFLFAQNLERKSTLRSHFEKNKNAGIIPCYQDNHRTLAEYLRKKLDGFNGINQEIINLLIDNSGFDRKVLSNEIDKIKVLFLDKRIKIEKLESLINNTYNLDFDKLRDSCLEGNKEKLNQNLGNIVLQNEDAYFYLSNLNLRIERLLKLQKQYKIDKNMDVAIENMRPKVFWKDKPIFIKQIGRWNLEKLEKAKKILIDTEIKMKTRLNNYNNTLIKNLIINLYKIANSTS
jgi:DNA polymerase III delta subunit|tara:strand:+ start:1347 stop:2348 length:1002 start_codon:yes stop_codon:yes gene_type:complete